MLNMFIVAGDTQINWVEVLGIFLEVLSSNLVRGFPIYVGFL